MRHNNTWMNTENKVKGSRQKRYMRLESWPAVKGLVPRGSGFGFQHPHSCSQPSLTLVPGTSVDTRHKYGTHTTHN